MEVLRLLKIGIPYETIMELDQGTITIILAAEIVIAEKQQEALNNG